MSAFDTVADRLGAAVDVLVDARLACRKYRDEHLFNPGNTLSDKRYARLLDAEHTALVKVMDFSVFSPSLGRSAAYEVRAVLLGKKTKEQLANANKDRQQKHRMRLRMYPDARSNKGGRERVQRREHTRLRAARTGSGGVT